jgi:hypothetical protein
VKYQVKGLIAGLGGRPLIIRGQNVGRICRQHLNNAVTDWHTPRMHDR